MGPHRTWPADSLTLDPSLQTGREETSKPPGPSRNSEAPPALTTRDPWRLGPAPSPAGFCVFRRGLERSRDGKTTGGQGPG